MYWVLRSVCARWLLNASVVYLNFTFWIQCSSRGCGSRSLLPFHFSSWHFSSLPFSRRVASYISSFSFFLFSFFSASYCHFTSTSRENSLLLSSILGQFSIFSLPHSQFIFSCLTHFLLSSLVLVVTSSCFSSEGSASNLHPPERRKMQGNLTENLEVKIIDKGYVRRPSTATGKR